MARTRLTARKSTGGRAPRHPLAARSSCHKSKFLEEFGMVLSSMGYPEGREPRYYWDKEQLDDRNLMGIEAVVPTSGGDPAWGGRVYESRGATPFHGASRAAFALLRDLMARFPQKLVLTVLKYQF